MAIPAISGATLVHNDDLHFLSLKVAVPTVAHIGRCLLVQISIVIWTVIRNRTVRGTATGEAILELRDALIIQTVFSGIVMVVAAFIQCKTISSYHLRHVDEYGLNT